LEVRPDGSGEREAVELAEVIGAVMGAEEETGQVAAELSGRYEEIDLIYTISEILGHTIRLDEAANRILREVSAVVRARRATLMGGINLTDRTGEDAFTAGDRKLVAAIANQIGAAIENARLVERDLGQQRVRRELELAHDLQLKLLPSPAVVAAKGDVAARCRPAESVGGDFYNLLSLHGEGIGVMIGDVSSHGFGAALIMALAMAASGIHAETAESPHEAVRRLEMSLAEELAETEMFLTLCYAVVDPANGTLTYANAGHPHAFLVSAETGAVTRLDATRPPLGLGDGGQERALPFERGK